MSTDLVVIQPGHDRRRWVGGSDVAAILGHSKFRTALDVYNAKTSDVPEEMDPEKRLFLERRKRWEPVVIQMLKEELEAEIVNVNLRYQDADVPYFAAEIDAEAKDDGELINVEVKTVSPYAYGERYGWGEPGTNDVPIDYEAQVLHGLGVTKRRKAVLVAMVGLDQMHFYPITRDDATLTKMRAALMHFWNHHVLQNQPPDPRTLKDVNNLYRVSTEMACIPDEDTAAKALRLRAINAQIDALLAEGDALEFDVKRFMKSNDALTLEGKKIISWKEQGWSAIDHAALKRDRLHSKYTITGTRRVFKTLKG